MFHDIGLNLLDKLLSFFCNAEAALKASAAACRLRRSQRGTYSGTDDDKDEDEYGCSISLLLLVTSSSSSSSSRMESSREEYNDMEDLLAVELKLLPREMREDDGSSSKVVIYRGAADCTWRI